MVNPASVLLGLGSNVGDRDGHLQAALQRLATVPGVRVLRCSSFLDSALLGDGPPQGPFRNAVAELSTTLPPAALLAVLKELERQAGRLLPAPRNHPRPLDLDLLTYGELRLDTRDLVLPHPRWHERPFVLEPLRELGIDLAALPRHATPLVVEPPLELAALCSRWQAGGCVVGLVPTMGSLHAGHRSLIERARAECDRVVATIFVNPLQFGPGEDFAAYPRDLAGDLAVCRAAGADAVFAPSVAQMYDPEFCSHLAVGPAAEGMEGALRPGHFAGVATVVARLFAIARPHRAYFGQKDAQQLAVVRRMARDLGFPLQVVACPIVREPDGLAMSSRNVYLGAADRQAATILYRALRSAQDRFRRGRRERDDLVARVREVLATELRASVDYVELRDEVDLAPLPAGPVEQGRLLVAARFVDGPRPVRLLDNLALAESGP
jgi:pantoate--beta-alanine ligase